MAAQDNKHRNDGLRSVNAREHHRPFKSWLNASVVLAVVVLLVVAIGFTMKPLVELQRAVQRQRLLCRLKREAKIPVEHRRFLRENAKLDTCAVVASSGAVLSHGSFASEIDAHDSVFRFNDAPVREFNKYVGNKETLRLMRDPASLETFNHTDDAAYSVHSRLNPNSFYLYLGGPEMDNKTREVFRKQNVPLEHVKVFDLELLDNMEHVLRSLYSDDWSLHRPGRIKRHPNATFSPTTGFMGMLLALSMCDHVDAYDMSPSYASRRYFYHYYIRRGGKLFKPRIKNKQDFVSSDSNSWHKTFAAERDLWARASKSSRELILATGKTSFEGFSTLRCNSQDVQDGALLQL